ncbi:MAG: LLM class flavin-dependent oxidoreductase [Salinirussus sp.]
MSCETDRRVGLFLATRDSTNLISRAESMGFDSVWAGEGQGKSAFGKLERWAAATESINLATGIVNVFSRSPAALAQSIATLDDHSCGRAILGLGVAHPGVVESFHGMAFDRPLARMAEYIDLVRRYLRGRAESFEGDFFSPSRTSFWDAFEPERAEIPIYNAALGSSNVRLTGAKADGWLPNFYPLDQFDTAQSWLAAGAERADRDVAAIDVAMYIPAAVHEDEDAARTAAAEHIAYYCREIPGYYDRVAANAGFEGDIAAIRGADSQAKAVAEVSPEFIEAIALVGNISEVAEELESLRASGVDLPIIRAPAGTDEAWLDRAMQAASRFQGH